MPDNIFLSLLLNIGLLVLVATVLTKVPTVRHILLNENNTIWTQLALAAIFGLVSIFSTYTGIRVNGALVNTRVIGVVAAGLLGGPFVGIGAAIIGGTHRYLFDIGGFTALSCAISTFAEGMIGAVFSKRFRGGKWDNAGIFAITAFAEIIQMGIILLVAKPFPAALDLVKIIGMPMIFLNAFGMVVFIGTFNIVFIEEDHEIAKKIRLAFQIVEQCLPHLRKGLHSQIDMDATTKVIFQSISCTGVMITDLEKIISLQKKQIEPYFQTFSDLPQQVQLSLKKQQVTEYSPASKEDPLFPLLKNHLLIAAPLVVKGEPIGSLILVIRKQWNTPNSNLSFIDNLAQLFSTQLELSDLDYQKKLRQKAEFRALQSQVNPHFLYNALNTISYVCRESSSRARELLLVLATYYRQTLENDRYMISLETEIQHIRNYLELEKARFEEKLHIEIDVPEEIDCKVPSFILQPLVENAIRHGADLAGNRYLQICASLCSGGVQIDVADHGTGFDPDIIQQISNNCSTGKGVGLLNVHRRLLSIYGEHNGLKIHSTKNGSSVSFMIRMNIN